jgi:type IX secretion system substrate protein
MRKTYMITAMLIILLLNKIHGQEMIRATKASAVETVEWQTPSEPSPFNTAAAISKNEPEELKIVPDPYKEELSFSVENSHREYLGKARVYDLLGNCIVSQHFSNVVNRRIDLSDMSKGIYIIEVQVDDKIFNQKVVLN